MSKVRNLYDPFMQKRNRRAYKWRCFLWGALVFLLLTGLADWLSNGLHLEGWQNAMWLIDMPAAIVLRLFGIFDTVAPTLLGTILSVYGTNAVLGGLLGLLIGLSFKPLGDPTDKDNEE